MIIIESYQCEYCNRKSENKLSIEIHEQQCINNPKNRTCLTCKSTSVCFDLNKKGIQYECMLWKSKK